MRTRLTIDQTRTRLRAALPHFADAVGNGVGGGFRDVEETPPDPVSPEVCRELPDWVEAYGVVRAAGGLWLWLAPAVAEDSADMGQAVLDLPPGRYLVDTFDVDRGAWIATESALAPPLVLGVARRAGAIIVRITPGAATGT